MRQLWVCEVKINWDDPLPQEYKRDWVKFFSDLFGMNSIKFERCLKPQNAVGDLSLVIFSNGSESANHAGQRRVLLLLRCLLTGLSCVERC